jgi:hypothetical protein
MADRFDELVQRFQALAQKTGTHKRASYTVTLEKTMWEGWQIGLGCYDIGDWPRHKDVGPFETYEAMLDGFEKVIGQAGEEIERSRLELERENREFRLPE